MVSAMARQPDLAPRRARRAVCSCRRKSANSGKTGSSSMESPRSARIVFNAMKTFTIAAIPGDGVGREVVPPAKRVLEKAARNHGVSFAFQDFDWGVEYFFRWGRMMPAGASPLAGRQGGDIDLVIVRENTEGEYAPVGGFVYQHQPEEIAIQTSVFTRRGIERIVRFAFGLAVKRGKKKRVTSVTKSNAQGYGMGLWDRTFQEVALEFPGIETESLLVDAAAMNFIRRPESFDVVVASNLFGDILSDISAIVVGSMGLAASANLDPSRRFPSMFEPVHGSAPDIAGRGIVNPLAAIL